MNPSKEECGPSFWMDDLVYNEKALSRSSVMRDRRDAVDSYGQNGKTL